MVDETSDSELDSENLLSFPHFFLLKAWCLPLALAISRGLTLAAVDAEGRPSKRARLCTAAMFLIEGTQSGATELEPVRLTLRSCPGLWRTPAGRRHPPLTANLSPTSSFLSSAALLRAHVAPALSTVPTPLLSSL